MNKAVLIDLDGTLTDTTDIVFKGMKDGKEKTDLTKIKLFPGAIDFVKGLQRKGYIVFIISDSHPRYVNKIVNAHFCVPALSLADKPNITKTKDFLTTHSSSLPVDTDYFMIGDTGLDIELGRGIGALTVLTKFYKAKNIEERDGIGQDWKHMKSGPTFYADDFNKVLDIIENPVKYLLCAEAVFQKEETTNAVKIQTEKSPERVIACRILGRQNAGEIDRFAIGEKYFEFGRIHRTAEMLQKLALGLEKYISEVLSNKDYTWDFFTYVSDKSTTKPSNKMKEFFDLVNVPVEKTRLLEWKSTVEGSTKNKPDRYRRKDFVEENIIVETDIDLRDKNIIIIDDQYTTGATAEAISEKLIAKGAKNLLFVYLFYLVNQVDSERECPRCGKKLQVKINHERGSKFYSCVPPQFKGTGCGFIEKYTLII